MVPLDTLSEWARDARRRSLELLADLDEQQLIGPRLEIVNPLTWEIGHVAWFQEKWVLRHASSHPPLRPDGDDLWDSIAIGHFERWDLPLPSHPETLAYGQAVLEGIQAVLAEGPSELQRFHALYGTFHEDMHAEAFCYTRQTLGYAAPVLTGMAPAADGRGPWPGDVRVPGGTFSLGAAPGDGFAFDNAKWAHPVEVAPFSVARAPVTQAEFCRFVDDGGYGRRDLWSEDGWRWREAAQAEQPVYWRRGDDGWERRDFDRQVPLEPHRPVLHVNWYEADAWCRWAGRRLPTEVEWEVAAAGTVDGDTLAGPKRRTPWGKAPPRAAHANLDGRALGCVDVAACPEGDSAFGCRQMLGNVWEWTASDFAPYPGFTADPYQEYSEPCFGTRKVLRGGCWVTRSRLIHNTWRNFYTPERRDVWAGFRTCVQD